MLALKFQRFTLAGGTPGFTINAGLNDAWVSDEAPLQGLFITADILYIMSRNIRHRAKTGFGAPLEPHQGIREDTRASFCP